VGVLLYVESVILEANYGPSVVVDVAVVRCREDRDDDWKVCFSVPFM
jgi:hypothetical protein